MGPSFQFLVSLGAWVQAHHAFVLSVCGTVILVLGVTRFAWRSSLHDRRLHR
jgi:hypothetical protein